jgi:pyruvate kinase
MFGRMSKAAALLPPDAWNHAACRALIADLWQLRQQLLAHEAALANTLAAVDPHFAASARNLAHYVALRSVDLRAPQEQLARLGVSSLGRAEAHVLANLDKVLGILHRLAGEPWQARRAEEPTGIGSGTALLKAHTLALLGPRPAGRRTRIMVTLPSQAASDAALVERMVAAGMDIARINCAHDGPEEWQAMAAHVRRAARAAGRPVQVLMDLGGPKLRTGALPPGPAVVKLRPQRDDYGRVVAPARLALYAAGTAPLAKALPVDARWLAALRPGDRVDVLDARSARRKLRVAEKGRAHAVLETPRSTYLTPQTELVRAQEHGEAPRQALLDIPPQPGKLRVRRGDRLRLRAEGAAHAKEGTSRGARKVAEIGCTLPEVFAQVKRGGRIWFDDGRIGGVILKVSPAAVEVEITHARDAGENLAGDKGINLPDSALDLPALTEKDRADLAVVARCADLVGLSFAQRAADVRALRQRLTELNAARVGILLKIETQRGFENLPQLLFAAMGGRAAGVMIARGDLAVECGYERLAEVQEEILWAAEAAHLPVVWATQVLETLAKTGRPSRAEITDAAMGVRAECVMLNKGPHILDAMRTLDDILRRMQSHQAKKRTLLRALKAWSQPLAPPVTPASPRRTRLVRT